MRQAAHVLVILMTVLAGTGCGEVEQTKEAPPEDTRNTVDIITRNMEFEAPDTVQSGWASFRFDNRSKMVHFAVVQKLPAGKSLRDQQREIAPVFQNIMDNINERELSTPDAGFDLPAWFGEIIFLGGPGFLSPGEIGETTVYLEPGTYLMECYVKTGGRFHSFVSDSTTEPMIHQFEVVESGTQAEEPRAAARITVDSSGIKTSGRFEPGKQTLAVHFTGQKLHEHFLGHDVHIVRMNVAVDQDKLVEWMDWSKPAGLETPAPARFIGGVHEMPSGSTAYMTLNLEPGSYALIAEVPNAIEKNMFKIIEVAPSD